MSLSVRIDSLIEWMNLRPEGELPVSVIPKTVTNFRTEDTSNDPSRIYRR